MRARLITAGLLIVLVGCASQPEATIPPLQRRAAPVGFPAALYAEAHANGEPVYRIEPERSEVVILAYRGGSLRRFGHDHAIASRDVKGYVLLPAAIVSAQADLYVPVESLQVDEPAKRAQAGFDTQPSQQDIDGTRRNMMDKVLEATRYPFVALRVTPQAGELPRVTLQAEVTLHGTTRTLPITVRIDTGGGDTLEASGRFALNQTDFGIVPLALLAGAVRVEDRIDIEFHLHAVRVPPAASLPPLD